MAEKEVEILGDAIAGTEAEIFGEAVDGVETDVEIGEEPDRSLEAMDEAPGAEDADEGDDEGEADGEKPSDEPTRDDKGKFAAKDEVADKAAKPEVGEQDERRGNPAVALREERSRRQVAEAEVTRIAGERDKTLADVNAKLELALREIATIKQAPAQQPKTEEPKTKPDIFTDPEGYNKWVEEQIAGARTAAEQGFTERLINASMSDAHEKHGKAFETAFQAVTSLNRSDPAQAAVVRSIREAPNPGVALMRWHQQQETLREVGTDPQAYVSRKVEEALAAKMKDPEFRKQMLADMQAEARGNSAPNSGKPRTLIRTPPSLNGAAGRGEQQLDPRVYDNSEAGVFDSAFSD